MCCSLRYTRGLETAVGRITALFHSAISLWLVYQTRGLLFFTPHSMPLFPGCGLVSSDTRFWMPRPGLIAHYATLRLHNAGAQKHRKEQIWLVILPKIWKSWKKFIYCERNGYQLFLGVHFVYELPPLLSLSVSYLPNQRQRYRIFSIYKRKE